MDKNINSLIQGHFDFQNVKFKQNEQRFKDLVKNGQSPKALFSDVVIQGLYLM